MYKHAFANFTDGHLIALGFLLFLVTFLGVLVWTLFIQEESFYEELSRIPLSRGED